MGIANIINTAGGGGGGGSEIITNLVNSVDGAGLRLANSASIKCDDVAANRFGTADFSIEFVISQNAESVNSDIFTSSADYTTPSNPQAKSAAVIRWDVLGNGNLSLVFFNSTGTGTTYDFGVSLTADVDKPTHFVVSADRSANAVLFRNGAEVASVNISASSSENIGVGGHPAVVGLPNTLGFKGNIYRLRTYSKLLSSDEAKNVFDRADVPTALVSNLLLDLDFAYANPTQSTVIQDRGPNNQDGTLNGTITQTNVIKQGNLTSLAVTTSQQAAGVPADGAIVADKVGVGVAPSTLADFKASSFNGAKIKLINSDYNNTNEFTAGIGNLDIFANTTTVLGAEYRYLRLGVGTTEAMRINSTGLATFSAGITVSGGLTSLGSFSEVTISGGGITVTSSTHRVDTQNDDPTDQLSSISGGTDGSILVLQSVTSTRDVTVTHSNGTPAQNIRLAGGVSFTLDTSNDVLVLMKYGSNWREVSRSNNS